MQLLFEFVRGSLEQVVLRPGREPDQRYQDYMPILNTFAKIVTIEGELKGPLW